MQKSLENQHYTEGNPPQARELTVPADCAGMRLDQVLARLLPEHSRSRLTQWIRDARVQVDGATSAPATKMWGGERLHIEPTPDPALLAHQAQALPMDIVFEDAAIVVVNKPPGLVVHPGSGNWQGTLMNALLAHAPQLAAVPRAGIVHRLDKDTSGLMVVAKTLAAQTDLVRQLQARTVTREYTALAHGPIARDGKVEAPIGRHPVSRTRMAVVARGKPAVTHFEVLARFEDATLLNCRLETGRTHQIRVHLASIGHPLIGDPVYGKRGAQAKHLTFGRQALHARRLALVHPETGRAMRWVAPLPHDMQTLIASLEARA